MKYEEPNITIHLLEETNIITTSISTDKPGDWGTIFDLEDEENNVL